MLVKNELLSRSYAKPDTLVDSADIFTRALPSFASKSTAGAFLGQRHALVVALEVDKHRVAVLILLMGSLGYLIGGGVALMMHNLELGACIGAATFGLVASFQGMIVWSYG